MEVEAKPGDVWVLALLAVEEAGAQASQLLAAAPGTMIQSCSAVASREEGDLRGSESGDSRLSLPAVG